MPKKLEYREVSFLNTNFDGKRSTRSVGKLKLCFTLAYGDQVVPPVLTTLLDAILVHGILYFSLYGVYISIGQFTPDYDTHVEKRGHDFVAVESKQAATRHHIESLSNALYPTLPRHPSRFDFLRLVPSSTPLGSVKHETWEKHGGINKIVHEDSSVKSWRVDL